MNTDKLMELLAKATPGPWEIVPGDEWTTDVGTPEGEYEDGRKRHWNVLSVNRRRDEWETNRALIVAGINALPELLDELDRLRKDAEARRDAVIPSEIREYLVAASEGSMSRNNSEQMASELLIKLDADVAAEEGRE